MSVFPVISNGAQLSAAFYSVIDNAYNLFGGQNSNNSPVQAAYAVNLGISLTALIVGNAAQIGAGTANLGSFTPILCYGDSVTGTGYQLHKLLS